MIERVQVWLRAHPRTGWALGAGALAAASFGAGRYSAPTRVETREVTKVETVEVVKWQDRETKVEGPVRVVERRVEVPGPQGPTVTVEKVVEREKVVTVHDSQGTDMAAAASEKVVERLVERDAPRWTVGGTIGAGMASGALQPPSYGALVGYRLLGPLGLLAQAEGGPGGFSGRLGVTLQF